MAYLWLGDLILHHCTFVGMKPLKPAAGPGTEGRDAYRDALLKVGLGGALTVAKLSMPGALHMGQAAAMCPAEDTG